MRLYLLIFLTEDTLISPRKEEKRSNSHDFDDVLWNI